MWCLTICQFSSGEHLRPARDFLRGNGRNVAALDRHLGGKQGGGGGGNAQEMLRQRRPTVQVAVPSYRPQASSSAVLPSSSYAGPADPGPAVA